MATISALGLVFIAACAAAVVWLISGIVVVARSSKSLAARDGVFAILSLVTCVLWYFALAPSKTMAATSANAAAVAKSSGTCASVQNGMKAAEVRSLLGEPTKIASDEDVWGPGAARWSYTGSRCRVHLVDGVVHLID